IITREIRELERDVADRRDVLQMEHRRGIHATLLAVASIWTHRLELITKDLERQRFETFIHRLADKGKYSLVNLLIKRHEDRPTVDDHGIATRACSIPKLPRFFLKYPYLRRS